MLDATVMPPMLRIGVGDAFMPVGGPLKIVFLGGDVRSHPSIQSLLADRLLVVVPGQCPDTNLPAVAHVDADVVVIDVAGCAAPLRDLSEAWKRCAPSAAIVVLSRDPTTAVTAAAMRDGADDVVGIPCAPVDVLVRVEGAYRRSERPRRTMCRGDRGFVGDGPRSGGVSLRLHVVTRSLSRRERTVVLTGRECALAELLFRRSRRAVSRHEILLAIWDRNSVKTTPTNLVDVYVRLLRRRLAELGEGDVLETVRYVGYRLNADAQVA